MLLDGDSIELYSYTEAGEFSFTTYRISDCIEKQDQSLCGLIQQVIEKMRYMEQEHKGKYMQKKLGDCFPADHQYRIGKIYEAINLIDVQDQGETTPQRIGREGRINLAFSHAKTLIEAVNRFNREFAERKLHDVSVCIAIEHSKYPLEKLKEYFSPTSRSPINSQDARAYADSAEKHLLELAAYAKNLDNEYASTS
jgi:hypothetical protein